MNVTFSFSATLTDWTDDGEGGFDLWWCTNCTYDARGRSTGTAGVKKRAADVWLRLDGPDDVRNRWSWTAYHPFTGEVLAAGHRLENAELAAAQCLEVIHLHFHNKVARGLTLWNRTSSSTHEPTTSAVLASSTGITTSTRCPSNS